MDKEEIDSLDIFLDKLCFSFSVRVQISKPQKVEFYNSPLWILNIVQERVYSYFIDCPLFSLRESETFPVLKFSQYYINVGYFLDLYENKRARGENVKF